MLERDVQRFNERKEFERQVGFLQLPSSLRFMVISDCARGAYSTIHGIHGSEALLHRRQIQTTRPP